MKFFGIMSIAAMLCFSNVSHAETQYFASISNISDSLQRDNLSQCDINQDSFLHVSEAAHCQALQQVNSQGPVQDMRAIFSSFAKAKYPISVSAQMFQDYYEQVSTYQASHRHEFAIAGLGDAFLKLYRADHQQGQYWYIAFGFSSIESTLMETIMSVTLVLGPPDFAGKTEKAMLQMVCVPLEFFLAYGLLDDPQQAIRYNAIPNDDKLVAGIAIKKSALNSIAEDQGLSVGFLLETDDGETYYIGTPHTKSKALSVSLR